MADDKAIDKTEVKAGEETAQAAPDDGRADYVVTKFAGPRVAGRLVKAGDTLRLTGEEAQYHLAAGEIITRAEAEAAAKPEAAPTPAVAEAAAKSEGPSAPSIVESGKGRRGA